MRKEFGSIVVAVLLILSGRAAVADPASSTKLSSNDRVIARCDEIKVIMTTNEDPESAAIISRTFSVHFADRIIPLKRASNGRKEVFGIPHEDVLFVAPLDSGTDIYIRHTDQGKQFSTFKVEWTEISPAIVCGS